MKGKGIYLYMILGALASIIAVYGMGWHKGATAPTFPIKVPDQYIAGKDTTAFFGNGRYQIMHGFGYSLYDSENYKDVISDVSSYKETESRLTAFIYGQVHGQDSYCVLHEETNQLELYSSPDQIPDRFKEIFETLKHRDIRGNKID